MLQQAHASEDITLQNHLRLDLQRKTKGYTSVPPWSCSMKHQQRQISPKLRTAPFTCLRENMIYFLLQVKAKQASHQTSEQLSPVLTHTASSLCKLGQNHMST